MLEVTDNAHHKFLEYFEHQKQTRPIRVFWSEGG